MRSNRLTPYLIARLGHALAKQTISDALKIDSSTAQAMLENLLNSTADASQRAVVDLLALQAQGLTAAYFSTGDLTGTPKLQTDAGVVFDGDTTITSSGNASVRWTGMLLAPNNGDFTFTVQSNGKAGLWISDPSAPQLTLDSASNEWVSGPIPLKAGQLYSLRLEVTQIPLENGAVQLFWQSAATPKAIIPSDNLYPSAPIDAFAATFVRLHKAALFVNLFKLSEPELTYLASPPSLFAGIAQVDLNALPLTRDASHASWIALAPALFRGWQRVNNYVTLRNSLPHGEVSLVDVFATKSLDDAKTKLAQATAWDRKLISALVDGDGAGAGFGLAVADLNNELWPFRLQACVRLIKRLGVSASQLFNWASIDSQFTALEAIAQDIQKTVQAKYDQETWLTVAKPLNDELRDRQRAALVSYLLPRMNLTDSNQLFEYFLIDAEMGLCMETSRLVQAISSVQLFVQRCLLGLEERDDDPSISVSPHQIDAEEWEQWRKWYRVWQANRRVFLYPENWLETELRDDKSPFFKEFESELLQNEITTVNCETAFLNYLEKLDQVARLEIMGMFWQDVDPDTGEQVNILHVFARTFHPPHVYFYRRLMNLTTWTPWEKMSVDIQGDHIIPVIWNRRLYVFWPTFAKKADAPTSGSGNICLPNQLAANALLAKVQQARTDANKADKARDDAQAASDKAWDDYCHARDQEYHDLLDSFEGMEKQFAEGEQKAEDWAWRQAIQDNSSLYDQSQQAAQNLYQVAVAAEQADALANQLEYQEKQAESGNQCGSISTSVPSAYWEISLNWSENKHGKWSPKQVAKQVLQLDPGFFFDDDPTKYSHYRYVFKTEVTNNGDLLIQCGYHCDFMNLGSVVAPCNEFFVYVGEFDVGGCAGESVNARPYKFGDDSRLALLPQGADFEAMKFTELIGQSSLRLIGQDGSQTLTYLRFTPTKYKLLYPHQYQDFLLQAPFFYEDTMRTYFVAPIDGYSLGDQLANATHVGSYGGLRAPAQITMIGAESPVRMLFAQPLGTSRSSTALPLTPSSRFSTRGSALTGAYRTWGSVINNRQFSWDNATVNSGNIPVYTPPQTNLQFGAFYHPFVCEFMKSLTRLGIKGLLTVANQSFPDRQLVHTFGQTGTASPLKEGGGFKFGTLFEQQYSPLSDNVQQPYPKQEVDFSYAGAYSLYNWELFFHAPMLIATRLTQNQRFADARTWFHYIFNPTDDTPDEQSPARYWKVLPFKTSPCARIEDLMLALDQGDASLVQEINDWAKNPFQPYSIARLRSIAFQKNVFMKYLDNLIAWGDQLFGQDTMESVNQAEQLYILAADLLGPRPQEVPTRLKPRPESYATLKAGGKLDAFSNAPVQLENIFHFSGSISSDSSRQAGGLLGFSTTLYFCIPQNDKLLGYWDTVSDRLFKIRNCMNIQGVVRELPLFAPPIDPALLVQAAAQGVDLSSVFNDINAPLPNYRFTFVLQKAFEMCAECRSLGGALLSAQEKNDAEALALLRATQETNIQILMKQIKSSQLEEAQDQVQALQKSREVAKARYQYYQSLLTGASPEAPDLTDTNAPSIRLMPIPMQQTLSGDSGTRLLQEEQSELDSSHSARDWQVQSGTTETLAGMMHYIPDIPICTEPFGVGVQVVTGGTSWGLALAAISRYQRSLGEQDSYDASHAGKLAGYFRRHQEWTHQSNLAANDIMQIDQQLLAAKVRESIADYELNTLYPQQLQNAQDIQDFLANTKFTNQDLYGWMISDISATYFQSYQMAYSLAKKAERAFRFERGITDSNYIQFGYWDSLRKGLQSGERLYLALKQMEQAYLDQNKREYEITKNVSLMLHDPLALIALKQTGKCEVFLPEALFDADYPGHYMRRIKSVGLTIPCVVGPYTSVNCTLTLLSNKTRISSLAGDDEEHFVSDFVALQCIATSHGQNDSGMFELNFRDERYLSFEGAGVISHWRIDLPIETNAFDFNTLTDVVLHVKYTAREGGDILRNAAKAARRALLADNQSSPLARLFSLKHEFPNEWYRFLHPTDLNSSTRGLEMKLDYERFPFQFRGQNIQISQVDLFLGFKDPQSLAAYTPLSVSVESGNSSASGALNSDLANLNGTPHLSLPLTAQLPPAFSLTLSATSTDVKNIVEVIDDLALVCHYTVS